MKNGHLTGRKNKGGPTAASNRTQGSLLALSGSHWQACTLHAGVAMDLFTHIGKEGLTAGAIARKRNTPARGLAMLLNALAAMGLLKKTGDTYADTQAGLEFLSRDSDRHIGYMIRHHHRRPEMEKQ